MSVITYGWKDSTQYTCEVTIVPSTALDEGVIMSLVSPWPSFRFFLILIRVKVHFFLDRESMHQHLLSSSGENFQYPPCSICIGNDRNYHHSLIIQSIVVELGLHLIRFFFILWQSHPGWLEKLLREHLRFNERYHAIPCDTPWFGIAEAGCFPAVHFPLGRTEWWGRLDDIGCMFRLKIEVPLGTPVKTSLVPKIMAWFLYFPMIQTKIAALQNCHLGSSCIGHRNTNLGGGLKRRDSIFAMLGLDVTKQSVGYTPARMYCSNHSVFAVIKMYKFKNNIIQFVPSFLAICWFSKLTLDVFGYCVFLQQSKKGKKVSYSKPKQKGITGQFSIWTNKQWSL